ncbi:MAG: haloacid dehalogenase-like hydrolase [Oscillospiraceae bacterium]|nr:haloacid dehalogenase-like hydrolase [Oscillospiraceae bacterium]
MNVYDFDKTIYDGDSSMDFYRFCLRSDLRLMRFWPKQLWGLIGYQASGRASTRYKSLFLAYLRGVRDLPDVVARFWDAHRHKLKGWYLAQKRADDVIISASPVFLLRPICAELGVSLIATEVDEKSGALRRRNCRGNEKPLLFREKYPDAVVDEFYSDSNSDVSMARLAARAYFVCGDRVEVWEGLSGTQGGEK